MIMGNQNHIYSLDSFLDIDLLDSLKYSPMSNKSFTVSCWLYAFYHLFFPNHKIVVSVPSVPHYGYTTYGRKFSSLSMMCTMPFKASLTMLISPTEKSGFPLLSFWMIMVSDVPEDRTTRLRVSSSERMLTRRSPFAEWHRPQGHNYFPHYTIFKSSVFDYYNYDWCGFCVKLIIF